MSASAIGQGIGENEVGGERQDHRESQGALAGHG